MLHPGRRRGLHREGLLDLHGHGATSEGIAFYYREVPAGADFELSATATVGAFVRNNQVSFGIMVRDTVYDNEFLKTGLGSYLAVGPVQTAGGPGQYVFRRIGGGTLARAGDLANSVPPGPGATYRIRMKKSGDLYVLSFGGEEPIVVSDFPAFSGEVCYVGLYTSRNTTVTFSDLEFSSETRAPVALRAVPTPPEVLVAFDSFLPPQDGLLPGRQLRIDGNAHRRGI